MPLTDQERPLLTRAREYVASGRLPRTVPKSIFAGPGTGMSCSLCDSPIEPWQVEYELSGGVTLHFHMRCHAIWQLAASENAPGSLSP